MTFDAFCEALRAEASDRYPGQSVWILETPQGPNVYVFMKILRALWERTKG